MNKRSNGASALYVDLDRRFQPLTEANAEDLEVLDAFPGYMSSALTWSDILKKRRVVILAEAGSGKSKELEAQARQLAKAGRPETLN